MTGDPATSGTIASAGQVKVDRGTERLWRVVVLALGGLLIAVAVAGLAALTLTLSVANVVDNALRNDIELEDEADDFRAAVLDVRHYHRNLVFTGPTRIGLEDFDRALAGLFEELDELAAVEIESPDVKQADELRAMAGTYANGYRPAVDLYLTDRAAFDTASDLGLTRLAELQAESERLDGLGEELAEQALLDVERATSTSTLILLAVLAGVTAGGLALAIAAIRVLRELRRLDLAQREATAALAAALRSKTDFIADASHELRTPLTVVRGNAEVALATGPSDEHTPMLNDIVAESERMTRLVEDLLFLARSDAGSNVLELTSVELEPWLADISARAEMLCRERGVSLTTSMRAHGEARLDPDRIGQATMILVDNAAKFSPAGAEVGLSSRVSAGILRLEVADRGPGIPPDLLPHVFDRFRRVDRARGRQQGGAGLGLSIAQAIVAGHGGTIEPATRAGGGLVMTIQLPAVEPSVRAPLPIHG
jgi:two-component system sensor histidine kinase VicK